MDNQNVVSQLQSHEDKSLYFGKLRRASYDFTVDILNETNDRLGARELWDSAQVGPITDAHLHAARTEFPKHYPILGQGGFTGFEGGWDKILRNRIYSPSHFEMAITLHKRLIGLAFGGLSKDGVTASLTHVERNQGATAFKGRMVPAALICIEQYARLVGSRYILVKSPLHTPIYQRYGFEEVQHPGRLGGHLRKEVTT